MKRRALLSCLVFMVVVFAVALSSEQAFAYTIRKAAYAGTFYPAQPNELKASIAQFTRNARSSPVKVPKDKQLKAMLTMKLSPWEFDNLLI
ncbi:MAG: hypothetical protein ABSA71_15755 [Desulfomonilia bacterium]|jgi:hypothetical protein